MLGVSSPKVSNNPTYRLIIDFVRRNHRVRIRDIATSLNMRVEEVEMYVYKGVNENYLMRVGMDNKIYVMAKYRQIGNTA